MGELQVKSVPGVLAAPVPEVDAVGFGESSVDLMVRFWTLPQIAEVRRVRSRVVIALKQSCDRAGISIPFPIRTIYHYNHQQDGDGLSHSSADSSGL